jgi:hypothetical protein
MGQSVPKHRLIVYSNAILAQRHDFLKKNSEIASYIGKRIFEELSDLRDDSHSSQYLNRFLPSMILPQIRQIISSYIMQRNCTELELAVLLYEGSWLHWNTFPISFARAHEHASTMLKGCKVASLESSQLFTALLTIEKAPQQSQKLLLWLGFDDLKNYNSSLVWQQLRTRIQSVYKMFVKGHVNLQVVANCQEERILSLLISRVHSHVSELSDAGVRQLRIGFMNRPYADISRLILSDRDLYAWIYHNYDLLCRCLERYFNVSVDEKHRWHVVNNAESSSLYMIKLSW